MKTIMKYRIKILMAVLMMGMAITSTMFISCSDKDDEDAKYKDWTPLPQEWTVSIDTVSETLNDKKFKAGDRLYVFSPKINHSRLVIEGMLDIKSGIGTNNAVFTGNIYANSSGKIYQNHMLKVVLLRKGGTMWETDSAAHIIGYPTDAFCTDLNEAMTKYSCLYAQIFYTQTSFKLKQRTTFLNFTVPLENEMSPNSKLPVKVVNGETILCAGNVLASQQDGNTGLKFVLPLEAGTQPENMKLYVGDNEGIDFTGLFVQPKSRTQSIEPLYEDSVYNVCRGLGSLTKLEGDVTFNDGEIISGALIGRYKISIADGAKVTLRNATIDGWSRQDRNHPGISCEGNAIITLEGKNYVRSFNNGQSGIHVPEGSTLTIRGDGELEVCGDNAAAIGSAPQLPCGNIVIENGNINAFATYSAAIGAGCSNCGNITISGGNITANGYFASSPGIGCGTGVYHPKTTCGDITITGGNINTTGDGNSSGIGIGQDGSCGNIVISGGTIKSMGSLTDESESKFGASTMTPGIGGGKFKSITITSGITRIEAIGDKHVPAIGKGHDNGSGDVNIDGVLNPDATWDCQGMQTLKGIFQPRNTWVIYNPSKWNP